MKKDRIKVSAVIVNFNGKAFIAECVNSVLKSDYLNFEIVIVDNASTDGSYKYLANKYSGNTKIKIIKSDRQLYFTGGSNLGAKKASGDKLFFLNSDAVVDKNCVRELVKFTDKRKKILVQPKILRLNLKHPKGLLLNPLAGGNSLALNPVIDNAGGRLGFLGSGYGIGHNEPDKGQYDRNCNIDYVNGTAFMIDRSFFRELHGFDEVFRYFYEDVDLSLRAKIKGGQCWYCFKAKVYHKGSLTFKKNLSLSKQRFYIIRNRILTLLKALVYNKKL